MTIKISARGPLLDVVVTEALELADTDVLLRAMDQQRASGPFVVLTDTARMTAAPRPAVLHFVEGLKSLPSMKSIWLADAVVVDTVVARFVLSTLLMIAPMPTSVKMFERRGPAEDWLSAVLRDVSLTAPARRVIA